VKSAFDAALNLLHPPPPEHEPEPEFESQPEPAVEAPDASEEEEEDDDDPDDDDDLEDEGSRDPSPGPQEVYQDALRGALNAVCADETMADPQERAARLQSIQAFDPLGVRIPTLEEARRMSQRVALRGRGPAARSRGWWWPQPKCTALHVCRLRAILGVGHTFRQGARRARAPQTIRHHCADRRHKTCCSRHAPDAAGELPAPSIGRHQLDESVECVATGLNGTREPGLARRWRNSTATCDAGYGATRASRA